MSNMIATCGKITASVNGFITANAYHQQRSKYRAMLDPILKRIEERLEALNLSPRAASLKAGLSGDAIRNIQRAVQTGRDGASTSTIVKLAPVLHTTAAWLIDGLGSPELRAIPKLSWVSAGSFSTTEAIMSTDEVDVIRVADLPDGDWVALEVVGDSMDRISPPGSIILVNRSERRLVPNACYIIQDDDNGATYKRFRSNPTRFEPVSSNPEHEAIFPAAGNTPKVFGRVKRTILDL